MPSRAAHLDQVIRALVAEVPDVHVITRREGELTPVEQIVGAGGLGLCAIAEPPAHELRRENATIVPVVPTVAWSGCVCGQSCGRAHKRSSSGENSCCMSPGGAVAGAAG